MKKRDLLLYAKELEQKTVKLEATIKFLMEHDTNYIEFVYKKTENNTIHCFVRYINDNILETALVETYPSYNNEWHICTENNRDFAIISSSQNTYQLDKKTKLCKYIKEKK